MTCLGRTLPALLLLIAAACSSADSPSSAGRTPAAADRAADASRTPPRAEAPRRSNVPRIVILGDSLTAGYGLEKDQAFPSLLQHRLDEQGLEYEVVNAGVSGDTTAGGLRRLDWSIEGNTRILVVALGGNDGLRGLPVIESRKNLDAIITRAQQRGITVLLAGMEAPPNYGPQYTADFRRMFRHAAEAHKVAFVPFLLEGVAGQPSLNIADGIHPNPEGARIVERTVWSALEPLLQDASTTR